MRLAPGLASLLALAACGDPDPVYPELDASRDAWTAARDASDDTYRYVRYSEAWTTARTETTIEVAGGVVIGRSVMHRDDDGVIEQWSETGAEIGSGDGGHTALTLDELYDLCATEVLPRDEPEVEIYFRVFPDGIVQDCIAIDEAIADHGGDGFTLLSIELEPPSCGAAGLLPCG